MSRTRKSGKGYHYRSDSKFHYCQKKNSGARDREFLDYNSWDAPRLSREAMAASRVAKRLYQKGWTEAQIIRKLRDKYKISQQEARECLPWEMRSYDDPL